MSNIAPLDTISDSFDITAKFFRVMEKEGITSEHLFLPVNNLVARSNLAEYLKAGCPKLKVGNEPKAEPSLDTIIHIDRSLYPVYPRWIKMVLHPELEITGPIKYDLAKDVKEWYHDGQKDAGRVRLEEIYLHLQNKKMLEGCLGFADGLEIQKKGIKVFRKFFGGSPALLWKSAALSDGKLCIPLLHEVCDEVVVYWSRQSEFDQGVSYPALRFN